MLPECATAKQRLAFSYGVAHPYSIIAMDMRLGKSLVAIKLGELHASNTLIICPAHLVPNWKDQINFWSKKSVTIFTKGNQIYDVCDSDFVVLSFDLIQQAEFLFEWADGVVLDESHNLAHMEAQRTSFIHRCVYENSLKYLYQLTGTPIKGRVKEFYSLLALTYYDPKQTDHSFLETYPDEITFAEKFSYSDTYQVEVKGGRRINVTDYYGLKNKEELRGWLEGKYIRIRADASDLPPLSFEKVLVSDIDDEKLLRDFNKYFIPDKKVHEEFKNKYKAYKVTSNKNYKGLKITRGQRYEEIRDSRTSATLPEHKKKAAIKKVPFTIKYVEDLMQSVDCCLIYSDHRASCQLLAKHFNVPAITGEMTGARRTALVHNFQNKKSDIICATVGALKEGSDLFRARDLILNDFPWVPGDIDQLCARTRKIGEKDPRTIHAIMGSPQDSKIWDSLNEKRKTIDEATKGNK